MKKNPFIGVWHITKMEQSDIESIEEESEDKPYFEFGKGEQGDFSFACIHGSMDYEIETIDGKPRLEFSFDGHDEGDEVTGRGWARIENNGTMYGKLAFHMGEKSWFKAVKQ